MAVTIKVEGISELLANLNGMKATTIEEVGKAIFVFGDMIRATAAQSITQGSISGKHHVPSPPGTPPSADTRILDKSIITTRTGILSVEVNANAPYAAAQEYGTRDGRLPERPFMRPAAKKRTPEGLALVTKAVERAIKRHDRGRR